VARRKADLLEATLQKYRAELKAGRDLSDPALREQIRKDLEADPDLVIDPTAAQEFISDEDLEKRFPEIGEMKDDIRTTMQGRRNQTAVSPDYIEAAFDVSKTPSATYVLQRGNFLAPGLEVKPAIPYVLDDPNKPFQFPDPAQHPEWSGTNRRLTLAQWMISSDNPLVGRVFVNHVWQWHFGEGIVRSVDDFGTQGSKPTHSELLDYLTVSFQEHNWDLKWLTKQIMLSRVYMQGSTEIADHMAGDPADKLIWRKAPLRLEAETIRDAMLKTSGLLDDQMFGRPEPIKRGPDGQWMEANNTTRRSLYLSQTRTRWVNFLHVFDCPDMTSDNQPERFRAALPTQALALMNNPLVMRTSKALADRAVEQAKGDYEQAIKFTYEQTYNRPPTEEEAEVGRELIKAESDPKQGLRLFVQAIFGANDFLYSF
jgi:hypothetical protein